MKAKYKKKKTSKKTKRKIYSSYKRNIDIKEKIGKRYNILLILVLVLLFILILGLFYTQIIKNKYYIKKVEQLTENIIEGESTPRGRIYDRNGKLIVDNVAVKVITYKKKTGITSAEEIKMAYELANLIEVDFKDLDEVNLKEFWLKNNYELGKQKITDEEWQKLSERKLTNEDIEKLKIERITKEELSKYNNLDKEAAYIYYLMNKGYSYSEKIIKKDNLTDLEYANVASNIDSLKGFSTKLDWERTYPYKDVFKAILGSISTRENGIPYELKNYYLSKGYSLDDRVGTSYLEYQYEDILKGVKSKYKISSNGDNILVEEGQRGNDIVITIDIELQKEVEKILEKELLKTKKEPNTNYYNRSFVVITDPNTGEILAMAGKQIVKDGKNYKIYDYTPGVTTSPVVVGSVIKGASHIVGYNNNALKIGEVRNDSCIKIAATPEKCSWQYLGNLNDITALKQSSNTYQFRTAIKVAKAKYSYNQPLVIDEKAFDIYRNTFAEFGLGVKTGIDLPVESLGFKGTSKVAGHLLDFSIGQYDTYTPIQLSQYIGTIANGGKRMKPHLLKAIYEPTKEPLKNLIKEIQPEVLNTVKTKKKYLDRVKLGFKAVLESGGTGSGYVDSKYKPAGKTGTSESFIDSDNDGKVDKETITHTFASYAPYDKPKVTFTVISPDVYYKEAKTNYRTTVNKRISSAVSKKYFEIYS